MELIAAVCHMLVKYYVCGVANMIIYMEDTVYIVIYEFIDAVG